MVLLSACTGGYDTLNELENEELTLEELEKLSTTGESPGGGGTGGGGTTPDYDLALLCKGKSSNNLYSARSTDVTGWTNDGTTGNQTGWGVDATLFNSTIYTAVVGKNTNYIYTTSSTNGSTWTSSSQLSSSHKMSDNRTPAIGTYDGNLYIVGKGENTELMYWHESSNGTSWTYNGALGNSALTNGDVSLVEFDNELYEFHTEGAKIRYSTYDGTSWSTRSDVVSLVGSTQSSHPNPYAVVFNGTMYVFYIIGVNRDFKYTTTTNGSTYTTPVNTGFRSNKRISATVDGTKLILAMKGNSSNDIYLRYTTNGSTWNIPSGNTIDNGYETNEAPAIVSF